MTVTLEIPAEQEAILRERAKVYGLTVEDWLLWIAGVSAPKPTAEESEPEMFWQKILRDFEKVPDEVFEKLPRDGASEHDHYIYGTPKKNW